MAPQVNGDAPSSAFISHLTSYPLISDSLHTIRTNPYTSRPLSLSTQLTSRITTPLLPYLRTPYTYISPYVSRADTLGDNTLSTIDSKFPAVKKPTGELVEEGKKLVFFPLKKGAEGKEYVVNVYGSECKKVGGEGPVMWGKAMLATGVVVGADALKFVSGWMAGKKEEVKEVSNEKMGN